MEVSEIEKFVKDATHELGEYEVTQCMNGTIYTISLLGEIAKRLAKIDDQLANLQFRGHSGALITEVVE